MTQTLDLTPLFAALDRVDRVFSDAEREEILRYVAGKVGAKAETVALPAYPPQTNKPLAQYYDRQRPDGSTYKSKFKNLKQQRLVMALASEGKLPYHRTGKLGQSITSDVRAVTPTSADVAVGSNRAYSPYVIDEERQSHYHQGNWSPLQVNLRNGADELQQTAAEALPQGVRRAMGE